VGPLRLAQPQLAGWTYALRSVTRCEIGDGLTIVKDVAAAPLRITRVAVSATGDLALASARFELVRFHSGGTTGEVTGSVNLDALRNGHLVGSAVGGRLAPVSTGASWYDLVALLSERGGSASTSQIRGLEVRYTEGGRTFSATFAQSVHVPAFNVCTSTT
jgi:hypothetical protein